jgi:hypothetical protein
MRYFHGARFFDETQIVWGASLSGVRAIKVTYAHCEHVPMTPGPKAAEHAATSGSCRLAFVSSHRIVGEAHVIQAQKQCPSQHSSGWLASSDAGESGPKDRGIGNDRR